jgi:hypothetical protein
MLAPGAVVVPDNLYATGTPDNTTFLRGDGVWDSGPAKISDQQLYTTSSVRFSVLTITNTLTVSRIVGISITATQITSAGIIATNLTATNITANNLTVINPLTALTITNTLTVATITATNISVSNLRPQTITFSDGSTLASSTGMTPLWENILHKNGPSGPSSISLGQNTNSGPAGSVVIGPNSSAGDTNAIAIGETAVAAKYGTIAIGHLAGVADNSASSINSGISIGYRSVSYGDDIAIGDHAGIRTTFYNNPSNTIAIGNYAGYGPHDHPVNDSIVIGNQAGKNYVETNSIILNASGSILNSNSSGFYVKPIRNASSGYGIYYDPSTGELTYSTSGGGGGNPFNQSLNTTDAVQFNRVTTNLIVANGTYISTATILNTATIGTVVAGKLSLTSLTNSTSSSVLYYDNTTKQVSYGPAPTGGGGGNPFNQSLNTTDNTQFQNTRIVNNVSIGPNNRNSDIEDSSYLFVNHIVNNTAIPLTIQGDNGGVLIKGNLSPWQLTPQYPQYYTLGTSSNPWGHLYVGNRSISFINTETNTTSTLSLQTGTIYINDQPLVDQSVTSTSAPTFAAMTATTTITINNYTFPAEDGAQGHVVATDGAGQLGFYASTFMTWMNFDGGSAATIFSIADPGIEGGSANSIYQGFNVDAGSSAYA